MCKFIRKSSRTDRGVNRARKGKQINRTGQGVLRAGYGNNKMDF